MKHTELYNEYKKLDELERQELIAAVKAYGGEYVFIDEDTEDWEDNDDCPIVSACFSYSDNQSDYYVSRVAVDEKGYLAIYGFDKEYGSPSDERELNYIETSHIGTIIDFIPATETVKDVSIPSNRDKLYSAICDLSEMLGEIAGHDDWQIDEEEIETLYNLAAEARDLMENGKV